MPPTKVLFLDNSLSMGHALGGAGEGLRLLVRDLRAVGIDTSVAVPLQSPRSAAFHDAGATVYRRSILGSTALTVHWPRRIRGVGVVTKLLLARELDRVLDTVRPDIVHINLLRKWDRIDANRAKARGAKVVAHVRSLASQVTIEREDLAACDAVICVSESVKRSIANVCRTCRVVRVYNGVDTTGPRYQGTVLEARRALGIPSEGLVLLSVAALEPRKGHDTAIRALSALRESGLDAVLAIAGGAYDPRDTSEQARLEGLAKETRVEGAVVFLGQQANMAQVYAASDVVYALSHDGEAFGRVPIEAALARRPIIATRVGATPEVVLDGQTGLLVSPGDVGDVVAKTARLLTNDAERQKLLTRANERALDEFGSQRCAEAVAVVYRELLA